MDYNTQQPSPGYCYIYLIPDGPLGKLTLTIVVGATTVIAAIFWVLLGLYACSFSSEYRTEIVGCFALPPIIERLVFFSKNTRDSLIGRGGDDDDITTPPLHPIQSENVLISCIL